MNEYVALSGHGQTACIQYRGAQIASLKLQDGKERIWQADPAVWSEHAPVLFPICGAPKDGKVIFSSEEYAMNKHGFTRQNPVFTLAHKGAGYADLVLCDSEETRKCYPFSFELHVIYTLLHNGYRTQFLVHNTDKKTLPFCIGGHPAFICPMEDEASFEDYDVIFSRDEDGKIAHFNAQGMIDGEETLPFLTDRRILPVSHREIDSRDSWLFTSLNSRSVRLVNRNTGKGLTMDFPEMEALAIWSMGGKNADYLCLEPWHGIPATVQESGKMEDKKYVTLLAPGESYISWFDVVWDL